MATQTTLKSIRRLRVFMCCAASCLLLGMVLGPMTGNERRVVQAQKRQPTEKPGPRKSGVYDFYDASAEFSPGVGRVSNFPCLIGAATQPSIYSGNMLIDCDGEVPHNETTIVVDPNNPNHAVGGYHSYQLNFLGATIVAHIIGTTSVTFDGGQNWREVVPPITPYQFTGDPALAFARNGRIYFANIADHEGPGGSFTGPSVVVATSVDGGLSWSHPVTVAKGKGAVTAGGSGKLVFNDKEFIAADSSVASPFVNRAYVTWTSFQEFFAGPHGFFTSPIMLSYSDNGTSWQTPRKISGSNPACSVAVFGGPNECDLNQDSYPTVAPNGKVYVSFENFNTPAENQIMVVSSSNGGQTWSAPVKVADVFDINFPTNVDGRDTLTGCQLRVSAVANSAADPSDPTGNTVYVVWADNRNGTKTATNMDVFLGRSTNGGATWTVYPIDLTVNDQFYPWVAVAPNGRVDVGYMDRSYSPNQAVCQYGFTLTRLEFDNAGVISSSARTRVDTGLSDAGQSRWFSTPTNSNSRFIGDYNGVATGSDGATWSLWTDQRNIVPNPPSPTRNHGQHAVGTRTP
jgi:hypothetical protein